MGCVGLLVLLQAGADGPSAAPSSIQANTDPVVTGLFPPGVTVGSTAQWRITGRQLESVTDVWISGRGVEVVDRKRAGDGALDVLVRADNSAVPGHREVWLEGAAGLSNAVLCRLDTLDGSLEEEGNDDLAQATLLKPNTAVCGQLEAGDVDHFRVQGAAGQAVTVEVEARRLGFPLRPVVTLFNSSGRALVQERESPGLEGDCRVTHRIPGDGIVVVRLHDLLFQGGGASAYRLRVIDTPFATALFPLGGRRGELIEFTVSGGTLTQPRQQRFRMPSHAPGAVDLGPFEGPGSSLFVDRRAAVGEGPEVVEPGSTPGQGTSVPLVLAPGCTVNGRIGAAGEVDRYRIPVRKGTRIRAEVQAAALGSWLDSVLTLRDGQERWIAENDDPIEGESLRVPPWSPRLEPAPTDSLLVQQVQADGVWLIEVSDRYGGGGDEFGYRLTVGTDRTDFAASFVTDPGTQDPSTPSSSPWVLNLRPGTSRRIPFQLAIEGRTGPIVVRLEGMPAGVTAAPVTLRPRSDGPRGRLTVVRGELSLQVAANAAAARGWLTLVAGAKGPGGESLTRRATAVLPVYRWEGATPRRPVYRALEQRPFKVLEPGESVQSR